MIAWIVAHFGYLGVALLTLAETLFPPLPSEVLIPLAGMEAQRQGFNLAGVIAAGSIGSMIGNFAWYALAFRLGLPRFKPLVERHGRWLTVEWRDIAHAEAWFARHAALCVLVCRLLPAIRTFISIPAGFARMPVTPYLFWSALGTTLWTGALAWCGWVLGENYGEVHAVMRPITLAVVAFFTGWYLWRLARSFARA